MQQICSSIGDALQTVNALQLKHDENGDLDFSGSNSELSDLMVLHRAVSILRSEVSTVAISSDSYPSSGEIEISQCMQFVPTSLINFMNWLCSKEAFENGTTINESRLTENDLLPTVALCHDIIGLSRNVATPIPFCLAV